MIETQNDSIQCLNFSKNLFSSIFDSKFTDFDTEGWSGWLLVNVFYPRVLSCSSEETFQVSLVAANVTQDGGQGGRGVAGQCPINEDSSNSVTKNFFPAPIMHSSSSAHQPDSQFSFDSFSNVHTCAMVYLY